jgi:glycosyltransferase involved in cell wall biosynthesis
MMRIAIVGDYPLDESKMWGGVESAFAYLARELARLDNLELHIVTMGPPEAANRRGVARNGAILHVLPQFPRFEFARNFETYRNRLKGMLAEIKPDLVHAQGATDHAYAALRLSYPTVVTVHGVQSEDGKHQGTLLSRARKTLYGLLIERYNLSHTRNLIAIGKYVAQYFQRMLRSDVQVYLIPNAIEEHYFDLQGEGNGGTILYAGRVIRRKRLLDLVQAFATLAATIPSAQLRVAGEFDSEPGYAEQVWRAIADSKLENRVRMLGGLSEEAIRCEYANCDLLALPSIQETTPMVIAQAMAASKPVVATPVGGVAEMVQDGETGILVPVGDTSRLADGLRRVLCDAPLRKRMGHAAHQYAVENYLAANVARKTYAAYSDILQ